MATKDTKHPPLLFLDLDDVLCLNNPYGGYDVVLSATQAPPTDLWEKLFDNNAKSILKSVLKKFTPQVVLVRRLFDTAGGPISAVRGWGGIGGQAPCTNTKSAYELLGAP